MASRKIDLSGQFSELKKTIREVAQEFKKSSKVKGEDAQATITLSKKVKTLKSELKELKNIQKQANKEDAKNLIARLKLSQQNLKLNAEIKKLILSERQQLALSRLMKKASDGNSEAVERLRIRIKQLTAVQHRYASSTDKANNSQGKFNQRINDANSSYGNLSKKFATLRNRLLLFSFGAIIVRETVGALLKVNEDLVRSQIKIDAILKSTGFSAGIFRNELVKMQKELSGLSGVSKLVISDMQGILLTFTNIGSKVFPEALKVSIDLTNVFGGDLRQNIIRVGKALNDPITGVSALRETGTSFTATQREMIKNFVEMNDLASAQAIILEQLQKETGNVTEQMQNTPTALFNKAFEDGKEVLELYSKALGAILVDIIQLPQRFSRVANAIVSFNDLLKDITKGADRILGERRAERMKKVGEAAMALRERVALASEEGFDFTGQRDELAKLQFAIFDVIKVNKPLVQINHELGTSYETLEDAQDDYLKKNRSLLKSISDLFKTEEERAKLNKENAIKEKERVALLQKELKAVQAKLKFAGLELKLELEKIKNDGKLSKEEKRLIGLIYDGNEAFDKRNKILKEGEKARENMLEFQRQFRIETEKLNSSLGLRDTVLDTRITDQPTMDFSDANNMMARLNQTGMDGLVMHLHNLDMLKSNYMDFATDVGEVMLGFFGEMNAMQDSFAERRIQQINAEFDARIDGAKNNSRLQKQLESQRDTEIKKIHNKQIDMDAKMIIAQTALAVMKAWSQYGWPGGAVAAGILGGIGVMQHDTLMAQKAAKGANFVTDGMQMLLVGDNPSGREHVQVTPLDDAPINPNLGSGQNIVLNMTGNVMTENFVEEDIIPAIKKALQRGGDLNHNHVSPLNGGRTSYPDWED